MAGSMPYITLMATIRRTRVTFLGCTFPADAVITLLPLCFGEAIFALVFVALHAQSFV